MKLEHYLKQGYREMASMPLPQNKRMIQCKKWNTDGTVDTLYILEETTLLDCEVCEDKEKIDCYFSQPEEGRVYTKEK